MCIDAFGKDVKRAALEFIIHTVHVRALHAKGNEDRAVEQRKAAHRPKPCLLYTSVLLYALVSVLTVFTSNDIIVLTFTPFICYFARDAKIDPIPYLICEFVAANTWSMALMIGNPTNIYLATAANVSFLGYTAVMLLPTLFAGFASFGMLYLLFRRKLRSGLSHSALEKAPEDPVLVRLGIVHLALCIVLLVFSSYLDLPMWLICFAFFCSLDVYKRQQLPFYIFCSGTVPCAPSPAMHQASLHAAQGKVFCTQRGTALLPPA